MIRVTATVPVDILDAIDDQMAKTPGIMQTAWKRALGQIRSQILSELSREPDKPRYPLRWKSPRQRRAVMAKLRREGNLPYQRTHRLARGWQVDFRDVADGGIMQVYNNVPYADFVQGDSAQPMHLDTGWIQAAPVITKWEDVAADRLISTWFVVSDPFAGIPR